MSNMGRDWEPEQVITPDSQAHCKNIQSKGSNNLLTTTEIILRLLFLQQCPTYRRQSWGQVGYFGMENREMGVEKSP